MYFLFVGIIVFVYVFLGSIYNNRKKKDKSFMLISFCILVFLQWYKDISVYPDIEGYGQVFDRMQDLHEVNEIILLLGGYEIGWVFLNFLFTRFTDSFDTFLNFIYFVTCAGYCFGIYKLSKSPLFSVLFAMLYHSAFAMSFFVLKQNLACSISFIAFTYIVKEDKWKYLILILMATLFHYATIVLLPCYWFCKKVGRGMSLRSITLIFLLFIVFSVAYRYVTSVFSDKYGSYMEEGGNLLPFILTSFVAILSFKGLMYHVNNPIGGFSELNLNKTLSSIAIYSALICLTILGTKMDRLALFSTWFLTFTIPNAVYNRNTVIKYSIYVFYIVISLYIVFNGNSPYLITNYQFNF